MPFGQVGLVTGNEVDIGEEVAVVVAASCQENCNNYFQLHKHYYYYYHGDLTLHLTVQGCRVKL